MSHHKEGVLILLSGGIDSTLAINYYQSRDVIVKGLHFQYDQNNSVSEKEAVQAISKYYNITTEVINFGFKIKKNNNEYTCRNAMFVLAACSFLPNGFSRIALGIHSGVPYYDCCKDFIVDSQAVLNGYFAGTVLVEAPFLRFTKKEIFEYAKGEDIPVNLTYSCEKRNYIPCGECPSCLDRRLLNEY